MSSSFQKHTYLPTSSDLIIPQTYIPTQVMSSFLDGPYGHLGMGKIEFDAVFDRGQCKLPDAFYGIKK